MASFYKRIIDCRSIGLNDLMALFDSLDLGAYQSVEIVMTLIKAGTGTGNPKLIFKHAAVNEPDAFIAFGTPVEIDLTSAGIVGVPQHFHNAYFLRWVRWVQSGGSLSANPIVTVDIIAKE